MISPILPKKASVLIVEDERIVARDLQQTLSGMGYDAFAIASSADEAIAHVSDRRPDLVLMDIRIKGARDGIQTAEILKQQFDLPIVYLLHTPTRRPFRGRRSRNPTAICSSQ
jgi:CheY-like chemotaxis protein